MTLDHRDPETTSAAQSTSAPAPFDSDAPPLLCPFCDYDLRGTPGNVCSECGYEFDRDELTTSKIPFSRRRQRSSLLVFWPTVFMMSGRFKGLANEINVEHRALDGWLFRAGVLAVLLTGLLPLAIGFVTRGGEQAIWDLLGDNLAGMLKATGGELMVQVFLYGLPVGAVLFGLLLIDLPHRVLKRDVAANHKALMSYSTAPLVWLGFGLLAMAVVILARIERELGLLFLIPLGILGLYGCISKIVAWSQRIQQRGFVTLLSVMLQLVVGAILYLLLLPAAVAYAVRMWEFTRTIG